MEFYLSTTEYEGDIWSGSTNYQFKGVLLWIRKTQCKIYTVINLGKILSPSCQLLENRLYMLTPLSYARLPTIFQQPLMTCFLDVLTGTRLVLFCSIFLPCHPNQTSFSFFPTPPFLPCEGHQPPVLLVTLLPGSVGLSLHLPGSPEPNSGCRSYFESTVPFEVQYASDKFLLNLFKTSTFKLIPRNLTNKNYSLFIITIKLAVAIWLFDNISEFFSHEFNIVDKIIDSIITVFNLIQCKMIKIYLFLKAWPFCNVLNWLLVKSVPDKYFNIIPLPVCTGIQELT